MCMPCTFLALRSRCGNQNGGSPVRDASNIYTAFKLNGNFIPFFPLSLAIIGNISLVKSIFS